MARREVVLETRNLSMHFGGVRAVDNVDFELREKELRCLIGPNGAGKSTFFKCLTGQLTPTSGDVVIRDIPMTGREPHAIAGLGVGIKTQVPNLFDGLSAYENLWLSARRSRKQLNALNLERSAARQWAASPMVNDRWWSWAWWLRPNLGLFCLMNRLRE
ncbi:MAG: ATP-binding cassette domain-containing protein [Paracoccaceae bacterium]